VRAVKGAVLAASDDEGTDYEERKAWGGGLAYAGKGAHPLIKESRFELKELRAMWCNRGKNPVHVLPKIRAVSVSRNKKKERRFLSRPIGRSRSPRKRRRIRRNGPGGKKERRNDVVGVRKAPSSRGKRRET